jgi:hypothetical protein
VIGRVSSATLHVDGTHSHSEAGACMHCKSCMHRILFWLPKWRSTIHTQVLMSLHGTLDLDKAWSAQLTSFVATLSMALPGPSLTVITTPASTSPQALPSVPAPYKGLHISRGKRKPCTLRAPNKHSCTTALITTDDGWLTPHTEILRLIRDLPRP